MPGLPRHPGRLAWWPGQCSCALRWGECHTKLPLYAHHGIPEAWLVDLPAGVLEIHREPEEGAYTRLDRLGPEDLAAVPLPAIPSATIDLTGLL